MNNIRAGYFIRKRLQLLNLASTSVLRLASTLAAIVEQHGVARDALFLAQGTVRLTVDLCNIQLVPHGVTQLFPDRR